MRFCVFFLQKNLHISKKSSNFAAEISSRMRIDVGLISNLVYKIIVFMKKIFTLFMGMTIALSMFATPRAMRTDVLAKQAFANKIESGFPSQKASVNAPNQVNTAITIVADNLTETVYNNFPLLFAYDSVYTIYVLLYTLADPAYGTYNSNNCMILLYDSNNNEISLTNITASYSSVGDSLITFIATGSDASGNTYSISLDDSGVDPYKFDNDSDYSHTFTSYEIETSNLEEYGSIYVFAQDEEYYVDLDITLPNGATTLVPGQYTADSEYGYQTFCPGFYDVIYGVVPSVAATLVEDGGKWYYNQVWYIVSGTITVGNDGVITVVGLNSLGHSINITIQNGGSAIEKIDAENGSVKRIVNGQLVIEREGILYNALGMEVK